jgi:hypothetical protein
MWTTGTSERRKCELESLTKSFAAQNQNITYVFSGYDLKND